MSKPRTFDYDEARRLRAEGMTFKNIAARLGVASSTVQRAVRDQNVRRITRRRPGEPSTAQWLHPCTCEHLGRWHRGGRCRILNCDCDSYVEQTIVYRPVDGSWLKWGKVSHSRQRAARSTR